MTGRPVRSPGRPPWVPPPAWWQRAALVAAVFVLDPVRAARLCWAVIDEFRKDG